LDFKVLKADQPVTGVWEFLNPEDGSRRQIEIRPSGAGDGTMIGTGVPGGARLLSLSPKSEGIGYRGELLHLLASCGQDRVLISDFVPFGDRVLVQLETKPSSIPCPFLETPETAKYFVAPSVNPVRLRAIGEITSERTREQIGLGGQPGGASTPIVGDAVSVEGGTERRYKGKARAMDGSVWIELEGLTAPQAGAEPPRGYLLAESLRVAATLTLSRPRSPSASPAHAP